MHCPFCRNADTRVTDSRAAEDGSAIRRRRICGACDRKFSTIEQVVLHVAKRSGVLEPFTREKIIHGVSKACQGRPVSADQIAALAQSVEEVLRQAGVAEIPSAQVGVAILRPLADLDSVAYLRFASVYKNFDTVEDFIQEIDEMKKVEPLEEASGNSRHSRATTRGATQDPLIG